ncbi:ABC transporter ATP-binding protein [Pseudalkalibacillus caeni]|uniref:ABC transporter ATP-binding protein n=1 Tax=Exobacillus caeni TaxID=2574798 RepID=A0A5R9FB02_9BACL|nr:ABC transporter ATP-binding protein [Pseudalkalibacillus caeni]TLS38063.1 ABC transporter ATP-binding protein [Pseudalkalibacillus caeni]
MKNLLEIEGLTGGYNPNRPVLHDVSFNVNRGEIVGLIGLNGAGKSTTIKHVLGLLEPMKGQVKIDGKGFHENREDYRKNLAFIPETPMLYDELTLWEHMQVTAMAYGVKEADLDKRSGLLLKEFRMEKMRDWFPSQFSKGMRQKVMIMCAFLIEPPLYIVDEPFVGLDPIGIQSFLEMIVNLKEQGAGILMSTHILSTAERYCDRFVILHDGKVVLEGTMNEMRSRINRPDATLDEIYILATRGEI